MVTIYCFIFENIEIVLERQLSVNHVLGNGLMSDFIVVISFFPAMLINTINIIVNFKMKTCFSAS